MPVAGKRQLAPAKQAPSKKRRIARQEGSALLKKSHLGHNKVKGKEKASDRKYIPIPTAPTSDDDDVEVSDQDIAILEGASFLRHLDQKDITKSKKELDRVRQKQKPIRTETKRDNLPSLTSSDEEGPESKGSSQPPPSARDGLEGLHNSEGEEGASPSDVGSDTSMPYELKPRKHRRSSNEDDDNHIKKIMGLPIKLPNGTIQKSTKMLIMTDSEPSSDGDDEEDSKHQELEVRVEDITTGARFGRAAVADIISQPSRKRRVEAAKEQIADICQEILAEPENSLGLLRRLHTFSLPEISTPTQPKPIQNDTIIRKLTLLSQLAVFKDIIPGYRIRPLTDKEKAEKVGAVVARTREWEEGLVTVYQNYLRSLETEIKERTELAEVALSCMCTLLAEVTHFNFSVNLISCIVARLSRKSWDKTSELCISTLIKVFREDLTGAPSLEIVRMLNRMIKDRRLRTELGVRASDTRAEKEAEQNPQQLRKGKKANQPHLSKKSRKTLKEKKTIEKEMREAEAEVDKEERATTQTETLKLLFALYFRILKNPRPSPLLPAALTGIAKFAHLINIDFFRDLMRVLKDLVSLEVEDMSEAEEAVELMTKDIKYTRHRLQCIATAFELLSGQGEALNIDLTDFVTLLYGMILPLTLMGDVESSPWVSSPTRSTAHTASAQSTFNSSEANNISTMPSASTPSQLTVIPPPTISDLLFSALHTVFSPRAGGGSSTPWRSAAFSKRLLTAALHWPPTSALRALDFIYDLMAKNPKLEALLSTEDRVFDGIYRPDVDDPQLCHPYGTAFWELQTLATSHLDPGVRTAAENILKYSSSGTS